MMELKCLVAGGKPGATPDLENHRSRPLRMPDHLYTAQGENPQTELCLEKNLETTPTWMLEKDGEEIRLFYCVCSKVLHLEAFAHGYSSRLFVLH